MTSTTPKRKVDFLDKKIVVRAMQVGAGIMLIFQAQPWLRVGSRMAENIERVPFVGAFIDVPILGDIIWFLQNQSLMVDFLGIFLCLMCVYFQLLPWDLKRRRKAVPSWAWSALALSYSVEILATFAYYPPYGNGIEDFIFDWAAWDPYLVHIGQLALGALSIVGMEAWTAALARIEKL